MIWAKDLNEEQVARIRQLAGEGATLGEIQKRLADEFQLVMTYLDARLLIGDLGVDLKGEEAPKKPVEEAGDAARGAAGAAGEGGVSVTMSELAQPGMIANGRVTFTDGESAEWYVDELGRLGLNPATEGYRPDPEDIRVFQDELQRLAKEEGL